MNDIAEASKRGRRTLYTYFSNKNDIYKAVIESELDVLYAKLEEVIRRNLPADEKLILLAFTRLSAIKEVVTRNGTLRADFSEISGRWKMYAKNLTRKRSIIWKPLFRMDAKRVYFKLMMSDKPL